MAVTLRIVTKLDGARQTEREMNRLGQVGTSVAKSIGAAFAGIGLAALAKQALDVADGMNRIGQRLALVTQNAKQAAQVQSQLLTIAMQTGQEFESIARIYSRIAANARELGVTQTQILTATQAIAASFRVAGATTAEAANSAQQLAQALGSGQLNGDELRSILENNLTLARAIADGFGVSVGQLRKMGEEGQLTSKGVFLAILTQSQRINQQLGMMAPTVGEAFGRLGTAMAAVVGAIDSRIGATRWLARLIDMTASGLLARFMPQQAQRMAGEASVASNRALTATGAANLFNQARATAAAATARAAEFEQFAREQRALYARGGRADMGGAARAEDMARRLRMGAAFAQGQAAGAERFLASGAAIDPAILRRSITGGGRPGRSAGGSGLRSTVDGVGTLGTMSTARPEAGSRIDAPGRVSGGGFDVMGAIAANVQAAREAVYTPLLAALSGGVQDAITDGFAAGITQAVRTGNIGEGFRSLGGVMLQGIGQALMAFGKSMLPLSKLFVGLRAGLASLNPVATTAAAVAIIGLGATMVGLGQRAAGAAFGGSGAVGGAATGSNVIVERGTIGALGGAIADGRQAAAVAPLSVAAQDRAIVNLTVIGERDPVAQRALVTMVERGLARRGV